MALHEAREPEWTGAKDFKWLSGGAGLIKGMLGGLLFGPKAKWCCYEVDAAKVAKAKEQAAGNIRAPYVSTNDVITSHFLPQHARTRLHDGPPCEARSRFQSATRTLDATRAALLRTRLPADARASA